MDNKEIFTQLAVFHNNDIPVCLATIIHTVGSTPRDVGAKMIVCLGGPSYGSLGGGCGEEQVRSAALRCLVQGKKSEVVDVDLTDDFGVKDGDVCGGKMLVFVEPLFLGKEALTGRHPLHSERSQSVGEDDEREKYPDTP